MGFAGFNALVWTATFLVPGFIWSAVLSSLVSRSVRDVKLQTIEFLTFSCFNYGLWSWLLLLGLRWDLVKTQPVLAAFLVFVVAFVSPVALGGVTGWLQHKRIMERVLSRFGFNTNRRLPTAWDYQFSREKPYWIEVKLKSGDTIRGFYGEGSFAGDQPRERDMYVEAVFTLLDSGEWAPVENTGGVWIAGNEMVWIEFRKIEEVNYES